MHRPRDTCMYVWTTGQVLWERQAPTRLDKGGGCFLVRRDHTQCSACCPSHPWSSSPGACSSRAAHPAHPCCVHAFAYLGEEACNSRLARAVLLPILLLVLWMGKGKKNKSWSSLAQHTLSNWARRASRARRTPRLYGPPMCTMAASSTTSGAKRVAWNHPGDIQHAA